MVGWKINPLEKSFQDYIQFLHVRENDYMKQGGEKIITSYGSWSR